MNRGDQWFASVQFLYGFNKQFINKAARETIFRKKRSKELEFPIK